MNNKNNIFSEYLNNIKIDHQRIKIESLLNWIISEFPDLLPVIKWNQPMFTYNETYIFGISISKNHIAISPESATILKYSSQIKKSEYSYTDNLIRIKWEQEINYDLIKNLIEFQIKEKKDYKNFWR